MSQTNGKLKCCVLVDLRNKTFIYFISVIFISRKPKIELRKYFP